MTNKKNRRGPSTEILHALQDELGVIDSILPFRRKIEPPISEESEEYEPEDDIEPKIESEEIELAVDQLIMSINELRGNKREAETLSDLFSIYFGSRSEAASTASAFEVAINGYFGNLFGEDLKKARQYLYELIDLVNAKLKEAEQ
jgi:hypothetical protein